MIDFVVGECRYELFVVPVPSYAYFFFQVSKQIVHSYQICVYVACLVAAFFNFHEKKMVYVVWVYVVLVCQYYLKI